MKIDVSDIFWDFSLIVCGGELITTKDPSLSACGYQLLPLVTSYLVDNNREFDVSGIFWGVLLIFGRGELITIEDLSWSVHGYQLLPLATSQWMEDKRKLMFQAYF